VQEQVHLRHEVRQRLGLAPVDATPLQHLSVLDRLALPLQMRVRLYEEATRPARRVQHALPELRVHNLHHEAHHGPGRVELARVAGGVAHLLEHRLVEVPEGVDLGRRAKVDGVDLVDDVPQEVAVDHPVHRSPEHGRDHVAPVATLRLSPQPPQVGEEPRPPLPIRPHGLLVVHERDQLVPGEARLVDGPVPPPVGRLDRGPVLLPREQRLLHFMRRHKVLSWLWSTETAKTREIPVGAVRHAGGAWRFSRSRHSRQLANSSPIGGVDNARSGAYIAVTS
jgi:hypothetical protein